MTLVRWQGAPQQGKIKPSNSQAEWPVLGGTSKVIQFLRSHRLHRPGAPDLSDELTTGIDALIREMAEPNTVDVREPSERTAG